MARAAQVLNLGCRILEQGGCTVLAARSPAEVFELAGTHPAPIHLLITDVVMPGMNGKELKDKLVASRPAKKCLYVSGYTANVIAHQGVLERDAQFLQEPFTLHTLTGKVRELLDAPRD